MKVQQYLRTGVLVVAFGLGAIGCATNEAASRGTGATLTRRWAMRGEFGLAPALGRRVPQFLVVPEQVLLVHRSFLRPVRDRRHSDRDRRVGGGADKGALQ